MKERYFEYINNDLDRANPESFLNYVKENKLSLAEAIVDFTDARNYLVLDKGMSAVAWDVNMLEKLKKVCGE